ncbi:MAG: hypothetical protein JWQ85_3964, partial [Mucilaginibacter sp.]|nr:hypothetical protein [Mucilaginibacter sp.]
DNRLTCRLVIARMDDKKLPTFKVIANGQKQEIKGKVTRDGNIEYVLNGGQSIKISWS